MRRRTSALRFGPRGHGRKNDGKWEILRTSLICPFHIIYFFNNSHAENAAENAAANTFADSNVAGRVNCGQNMAKKLKIQHSARSLQRQRIALTALLIGLFYS